MILKWFGVIMVILGCGGTGFLIAANYRREEKSLRQFIRILDFMECELQYHLTSLPELCRQVSAHFKQMPGILFSEIAAQMDTQDTANTESCMKAVLDRWKNIPPLTYQKFELLGNSIGRFDLQGQLKGIAAVRNECVKSLEQMENEKENKLRSYQTLGLCAGAALAILLV